MGFDGTAAARAVRQTDESPKRAPRRRAAAGDAALEFEYDDSQRWDHTPANYERRIAEYAALEV